MAKLLALDALVRQKFELSWGKARAWIETGKVFVNGAVQLDPRYIPLAEADIVLKMNAPGPGSRGGKSPIQSPLDSQNIIYTDTQVVVINKPSGISTVPYDETEKDTLYSRACQTLKLKKLWVVHRIDKETTGLVVFARTQAAADHLEHQFRLHTVHRKYRAIAHGWVPSKTIRSTLIKNTGGGLRGSAPSGFKIAPGEGQDATTHIQSLTRLDGATLVECQLETGRTHQIRIHLSEAGHPILGEKLYIRQFTGRILSAPRVMLHARELGFSHPASGQPMSWVCEVPQDFKAVVASLAV